jgi:hypothetical protein
MTGMIIIAIGIVGTITIGVISTITIGTICTIGTNEFFPFGFGQCASGRRFYKLIF